MKQSKGKFPVGTNLDKAKRFNPKRFPGGGSTTKQNTGKFPVNTSNDTAKRFKPPRP